MWLEFDTGSREGESLELGEAAVVGRVADCDVVLDDERASRRHARLEPQPDGTLLVTDLGSANGTFLGRTRITSPTVLRGGETLRFGQTSVLVRTTRPGAAPATVIDRATVAEPAAPPSASPPPSPPASPPPRPAGAGPSAVPPRVAATSTGAPRSAGAGGGAWAPPPSRPRARGASRRLRHPAVLAGAVALVVVLVAVALVAVLGGGRDNSTRAIVKDVKPSTVIVVTYVGDKRTANGTGWVLDAKKGLIVTNQHVVNEGTNFTVGVGADQREARILASAPCDDLALLQVDKTDGLQTLPLGDQGKLSQGDTVVALGYAGSASAGDTLQATTGVVSVVKTRINQPPNDLPGYGNVVQTDAAINPGNSGGPLVTSDRKLVGVNTASGVDTQNQGYAIGVDRVRQLMTTLRQGTSLQWAGLEFAFESDEDLASTLAGWGVPRGKTGLVVVDAMKGSDARSLGFGDDDALLTRVNNTPMDGTLSTYCQATRGLQSGDKISVDVIFRREPTRVRTGEVTLN